MILGLLIFGSLLASAFFSGIEMAFISANKFHIEVENKKGNVVYQLLSGLVSKPSRFIAAMLVGNNVALVLYARFMSEVLSFDVTFLSDNTYLVLLGQTVISTIIILIFAEFLPKALFNTHSNRSLEIFAIPSFIFFWLFSPIVWLMIGVSNFVMKYILRSSAEKGKTAFDKIDLDNYVRERTESSLRAEEEDTEIQIFRNALEFNEQKAREFMIPRTEMVAMDVTEDIEVLRAKFISSRLSKILIYSETIDNIIGYTHSFELFKQPEKIRSILRPVSFIPESMPANEILNTLIGNRRSIAVVLDEFGGTSGLITVEDIVEELFGEIDDEHDVEELVEKKVGEQQYLFSARQEIDYINEKYDLSLPGSDNYSTLSGLMLDHLESIPEKGEVILLTPYILKVEEVSNTKIELVHLRISDD